MNTPAATYRIQFSHALGFQSVSAVVSFLVARVISGLHASPILKSPEGTLHSDDMVDSNHLNPELRRVSDRKRLSADPQQHNRQWIQNIGPNQMAMDSDTGLLMNILVHGLNSQELAFPGPMSVHWGCETILQSENPPARHNLTGFRISGQIEDEFLPTGQCSLANWIPGVESLFFSLGPETKRRYELFENGAAEMKGKGLRKCPQLLCRTPAESDCDIHTILELLGHKAAKKMMICGSVLNPCPSSIRSQLGQV
jgi:hypothetical protein